MKLANLLGCILVFTCAVAQGIVTVASRIMQKQNWSVILFLYSVLGVIIFAITYLITTDDVGRLFRYSAKQYGWLFMTASL